MCKGRGMGQGELVRVGRERKREGEKGEREREMEWVFTQVWKNIVRGEHQEQKNCRDNVFISVPPPLICKPPPICKPAPFKIHWASGDHAQSICFHFIICISCLLAFDVLILWCSQETRIIIISIFKGVNGIGTCTHRFFPYNLCAPPPFFFFTPMFNIKDKDSKRWGSNVFCLKAFIYHVHFHFTQSHTYYEQNSQGLRRLALQCFRHTQRRPHTWILREAHTEKEGSRSKIDTKRQRDQHSHRKRHCT